jgi:hypothetical protein
VIFKFLCVGIVGIALLGKASKRAWPVILMARIILMDKSIVKCNVVIASYGASIL